MRIKSKVQKESFSIRIPAMLNQKLTARAEEIGISKSAVILSLIYKEFVNQNTDTGKSDCIKEEEGNGN